MRKPQRWFRVAAAVGVGSLLCAPVAGAHTTLIASTPAAGAVLSAAPASVSATFDEAPEAAFATLAVVGPDGAPVSAGTSTVSGSQLAVGVRPTGATGTYTANYRLMAADGHVVTGSWTFTVTTAG